MAPTTLVSNNEEAEILVGRQIPIQTTVADATYETVRNVTTVNYKEIGLKLRVRPTVLSDGKTIHLDIFVENSNLENGVANFTQETDTIVTSKTKNRVVVSSGQVVLIGGLTRRSRKSRYSGIPILSKLPGIGFFFRYNEKSSNKEKMFIFIRPTVV